MKWEARLGGWENRKIWEGEGKGGRGGETGLKNGPPLAHAQQAA